VLPLLPVAARRALHEFSLLVAKVGGKAVDLRLGEEGNFLIRPETQKPAHPAFKLAQLVIIERVVEREHRHPVADRAKALGRRNADLLRRAVGRDKLGKARLEGKKITPERVILGIRNDRRILRIIGFIMRADGGREPLMFGLRFSYRQFRNIRHNYPLIRLRAAARASSVTLAPDSIRAISSLRA